MSSSTSSGNCGNSASSRSSRSNAGTSRIDRRALVRRHNPKVAKMDPFSSFAVGNGEFAFNADVTGLQTFPENYREMPLCTMSQWGWHTTPPPPGLDPSQFRYKEYDTYGRPVPYLTERRGQEELYHYLRQNPHRLHLGRIGFILLKRDGREAEAADVEQIDQELDLWTGVLHSRFAVEGLPVAVETAADPEFDAVAVRVHSPLVAEGRLAVRIAFPYGSPEMHAADWDSPGKHETRLSQPAPAEALFERRLDDDRYVVRLGWEPGGRIEQEGKHAFVLRPSGGGEVFSFVASFAPGHPSLLPAAEVIARSEKHWERFWSEGGAVELADSKDPRAWELERRVVLSQFLTAVHCAGSKPPQESGLVCNSWYGKPHLEMHWWHAIHFPLWGRAHLFERSLGWYRQVLPIAKENARRQGYAGARWPKMVGPDGTDSPSPIGPLLIWQQPHPLMYAESIYRERPTRETLEEFAEIVFETAEFMASFAYFQQEKGRYVLGPPVIPAQECHPAVSTWNPTFELEYWRWGLELAQEWRRRMGYEPDPKWQDVIERLAPLPVGDGVYLAHENCPETFTERNYDHPSMLGALGILPGAMVDRDVMRRTLDRVMKEWNWERTWGWDYPMVALTAARLGAPEIAVDALLLKTPKNNYLNNGHNYQRENLPCYLPGNGGLLLAVAAMAAGWSDAPKVPAPGFPGDGSWTVRFEGLKPWF